MSNHNDNHASSDCRKRDLEINRMIKAGLGIPPIHKYVAAGSADIRPKCYGCPYLWKMGITDAHCSLLEISARDFEDTIGYLYQMAKCDDAAGNHG